MGEDVLNSLYKLLSLSLGMFKSVVVSRIRLNHCGQGRSWTYMKQSWVTGNLPISSAKLTWTVCNREFLSTQKNHALPGILFEIL